MIVLLCYIGFIFHLVNGIEIVERMIDGSVVRPGQFPFAARLYYENIPECTASIIHEYWALTAAHCIASWAEDVRILVGSVNSITDDNGKYYEAEKLVRHEEYVHVPAKKNNGIEYVVNDIALVRLKKPIEFSDNVLPIRLPTSWNSYNNSIAFAAGFGLYTTTGAANDQLRFVKMRVISDEKCREFYPYVMDKHLCGEIIDGQSPCTGDSGGPLFLLDELQIGITSTIADEDVCDPNAGPSLFTKVSSFNSWIQQQMADYGDTLY